jgi:hypothetical protein
MDVAVDIRSYITERIVEVRIPSGRKVLKSTLKNHKVILTTDLRGNPVYKEVSKTDAHRAQRLMKSPLSRHMAAVKGSITKARYREMGLYPKGEPSLVPAYKRKAIERRMKQRNLISKARKDLKDIAQMKQQDSQFTKDYIRQGE